MWKVDDDYLNYYQLNIQHAALSLMNDLELELDLYLIFHQQLCQPAHVTVILVD